MKKKFIYTLIGVITAALLGFVAIQLYWIENAVTLKEEEFKRDVKSILISVVNKLEKIETINRIKAHKRGQELYRQKAQELQQSFNETGHDTSAIFEEDGVKYKVSESRRNTINGEQYQQSVQTISQNGQIEVQFNFGAQGVNNSTVRNDSIHRFLEQQTVDLDLYLRG